MAAVDSADPDIVVRTAAAVRRDSDRCWTRTCVVAPYAAVIGNHSSAAHNGQGEPVARSGLIEHLTPDFAAAVTDLLASGVVYFFQIRAVGGAVADVPPGRDGLRRTFGELLGDRVRGRSAAAGRAVGPAAPTVQRAVPELRDATCGPSGSATRSRRPRWTGSRELKAATTRTTCSGTTSTWCRPRRRRAPGSPRPVPGGPAALRRSAAGPAGKSCNQADFRNSGSTAGASGRSADSFDIAARKVREICIWLSPNWAPISAWVWPR